MDYFVISNTDGDTLVSKMSEETLTNELNGGGFGDSPQWMKEIDDPDTNYWGGGYLIIRGEIVSPQAVESITKYKLN